VNYPREAIEAALLQMFATSPGMTAIFGANITRITKLYTNTPAPQPCFFLRKEPEHIASPGYGVNRYDLLYSGHCYATADASGSTPYSTILNNMLDAIDGAIRNQAPRWQPQRLAYWNTASPGRPMVDEVKLLGLVAISDGAIQQQMYLAVPIVVVTGS
jgi:hypothetical protein